MAVVVKRVGVLPGKKLWIGACNNCGTLVEFTTEDAFASGDNQFDGPWARVECPMTGCYSSINGYPSPPKSR